MRAIILAAGRGLRLQQPEDQQLPKCLLQFGGMSLLERHLHMLEERRDRGSRPGAWVSPSSWSRPNSIGCDWQPRPEIVLNQRFELGSVLTVHTVADAMTRGGDVLLMDADVLYDERIMNALVAGERPVNRVLIDRDFEAGDEPVKLCVRDGVPIELRKQLAPELQYRHHRRIGRILPLRCRPARSDWRRSSPTMSAASRGHMPHEEAVRDLLQERSQIFEVADVTGAPWIEIDFPKTWPAQPQEVLPQLQPLSAVRR